jgi:beta-galactosidase/beta-glucuronidase
MKNYMKTEALVLVSMLAAQALAGRSTIKLDGIWQAALGSPVAVPTNFSHTIPVPGLINLAKPSFDAPYTFPRNTPLGNIPEEKRALWYRTSFKTPEGGHEVFRLKVNKAMYGTKVWLNGREIGFNPYCYTPGYFDLTAAMRPAGQENELMIRVGTHYMTLPAGIPYNHDWETERYIAGIYDSVELICTGAAWIDNVQTVPDIGKGKVRLVVDVAGDLAKAGGKLEAVVRECKSGKVVGQTVGELVTNGERAVADIEVSIKDPTLWSPEQPFLYEVETSITSDRITTIFGLRSFCFDPESRMAVLNGHKRYLVGANAAMFRFFEDPKRGTLPWNRESRIRHCKWSKGRAGLEPKKSRSR